jgi:hypothetical protein
MEAISESEDMVLRVIDSILASVPTPKVVRARQLFDGSHVEAPRGETRRQVAASPAFRAIRPGASIAVVVGGRGVAGIAEMARAVAELLREKAAAPFIVPAMGGLTPEEQLAVLRDNDITEVSMGAPIRVPTEFVEAGVTPDGRPVAVARLAHEADGVILLGRVRPHSAFKGPCEGGLMELAALGLGGYEGAAACYHAGMQQIGRAVAEAAELILAREKILFGLAVTTNGLGRVAAIDCVEAGEIPSREPELLRRAVTLLPRLCFTRCDVLVVAEMGLEHSETGLDPNVTGRFANPFAGNDVDIDRLAILSLTEKSRGDAFGVGQGDIISRRLYDAIDPERTYASCLATTLVSAAASPMIMDTDELAVKAAIATCHSADGIRLAIIKNTRELEYLYLSPALAKEAADVGAELLGDPEEIPFDAHGKLSLKL